MSNAHLEKTKRELEELWMCNSPDCGFCGKGFKAGALQNGGSHVRICPNCRGLNNTKYKEPETPDTIAISREDARLAAGWLLNDGDCNSAEILEAAGDRIRAALEQNK